MSKETFWACGRCREHFSDKLTRYTMVVRTVKETKNLGSLTLVDTTVLDDWYCASCWSRIQGATTDYAAQSPKEAHR